jgi:ketosteroid isomerase-like protein
MKTLILMALSGVLLSAAPPVSNSDKEEVLAAMEAYKTAMLHKDRAALAKLVSDDIMYVHSSGTKYETKADLLKFNSSYENIIFFPDTTVRIHGKIALVIGKADFVHTATNISHIHVLHVWEKGQQGWQMIARQATKLP